MARVPQYDPQVRTELGPNVMQEPVGALVNQADQLQRATTGLSDSVFNIGLEMQKQANTLRVDDALNQAREAALDLTYNKDTGYQRLKGQQALQTPDGIPLADNYGNQLGKRIGAISDGLGNDAQRQAFQMRANDLVTQFRGQVMAHETQEFKTYAASVSDGIIATRTREIGLNYNNPGIVADAVNSIKAQTYNLAQLQGKSGEWANAQAIKMASNAHLVAIGAALENNDPRYADGYLKKFASTMDADDILKANGLIKKQLDVQMGTVAGQQVMTGAMPSIMPSDATRLANLVTGQPPGALTNAVLGAESGGKRYGANGQLLESPKGAKGEMQVLDSTNTDPGFGVRPAADNSPDERARVGRDYLGAMLRKYNGNVPQALAGYNAGPGATDAAIAQAAAAQKELPLAQERYQSAAQYANKLAAQGSPDAAAAKAEADALGKKAADAARQANFLNNLPLETQKYIPNVMNRYASGQGAPEKPTELQLHQQVDSVLNPITMPAANKAARQYVSQQFADIQKAQKTADEQHTADAQSALIANGGRFADLPLNIRANLPPGKYDDMISFADKVAKGQTIQTDWGLYYQLKGDTAMLGATNLMALRDKLSDTEFKQLTEEQTNIRMGKADQLTNLRSNKQVLDTMLEQAGINPNPKYDDKDGTALIGRFWAQMDSKVAAAERDLGRKLKPDEVRQVASSLFQPVVQNRTLFWNKDTTAANITPEQRVIVPPAEKQQISEALRSAGKPVTDDAIQALYRRKHNIIPLAPQ